MKEKNLIQSNEYLYLPSPIENFPPIKVFYAYKRIINFDNKFTVQYIFVKDINTIKSYPDIRSFEAAIQNYKLNTNQFVVEEDLNFIFNYSDKLLKSSINMYNYFNLYQYKYKKLYRYSKLYSSKNESFYYSNDYYRIKKHLKIYKLLCINKLIIFFLIGLIKKPFYIPIFFLDITKNCVSSYKKVKEKEADIKYYDSLEYRFYGYLGKSKDEIESEKEKDKKELEKLQEKYLNINITFLTLFIAFLTALGSMASYTLSINNQNKSLIQKDEIIKAIESENLELKKELDIDKTSIQILELIIQSNSNNYLELENLNKQLSEKIEQNVTKDELNDFIKQLIQNNK